MRSAHHGLNPAGQVLRKQQCHVDQRIERQPGNEQGNVGLPIAANVKSAVLQGKDLEIEVLPIVAAELLDDASEDVKPSETRSF